ncbi:MAG: DpnI domain-containing protein [Terracidiphilus sp.]
MLLRCDTSIADSYASGPQKSRVLSELWLESNGYCLSCNSTVLRRTRANTRATDFLCPRCDQGYELKAFRIQPRKSLVDGAYSALMGRILSGAAPTLMMLERNACWEIRNFTAIHHLFLTPEVVEKRKPLSDTVRRAGWTGCNIRLDRIATDAKISIVADGKAQDPRIVRGTYQRFENLKNLSPTNRGWTTLTLGVIRSLQTPSFTLKELYDKEDDFARVYPGNRNIRPKIRQQLQVLRDLGYLGFLGNGAYRTLI